MLDTAVIAALIGVFLLAAGYSGLLVHRLVRVTADPRSDRRRGPQDG